MSYGNLSGELKEKIWAEYLRICFLEVIRGKTINHGTGDLSTSIKPNQGHRWGKVTSLNITLSGQTADKENIYYFEFTSGETPTQLKVFGNIKGLPEIEPNSTYQICIENNLAAWGRWDA